MKLRFRERISEFFAVPLFRRIAFHLRRLTAELDRAMFVRLAVGLFGIVLFASLIVTLVEGPRKSVGEFFSSLAGGFYWAVTTVMGSGDASYVHSPVGYVVSWLLVLFGVAIVATITGALVGALIDYLIKEGQGMGAARYRNHIVVCGWNPTARELIAELMGDDYSHKIVLIHNKEKSPAGSGVYFVNGDATDAEDLRRAGIEDDAQRLLGTARAALEYRPPGEVLFLSDVAEELDAAAAAGLRTCQLVRAGDGTQPADRHPEATDFPMVAQLFGLPRAAG